MAPVSGYLLTIDDKPFVVLARVPTPRILRWEGIAKQMPTVKDISTTAVILSTVGAMASAAGLARLVKHRTGPPKGTRFIAFPVRTALCMIFGFIVLIRIEGCSRVLQRRILQRRARS